MSVQVAHTEEIKLKLDGATLLFPIIGDPIAQVKSPAGVSESLQALGMNALCVPLKVAPEHLATTVQTFKNTENVAGIIITVPHKINTFALCDSATERAEFLGSCNMVRRNLDGSWHGDMSDGLGMVAAIANTGFEFNNKRALLIGIGGAGTAIAYQLSQQALTELVLSDARTEHTRLWAEKLQKHSSVKISIANAENMQNCDLIVNATPVGMTGFKSETATPIPLNLLQSHMTVADVITMPAVTSMIALARELGCKTVTGKDMFFEVRNAILQFLTNQDC
ncbi:MAG: hypothetical protein RLZZ502_579 [Pseudomonadota bacterium]|jgi:shikimate dehydrogenase